MKTKQKTLEISLSIAVILLISLSLFPKDRTAIAGNCLALCTGYCADWQCLYTYPYTWRMFYAADCSSSCEIKCGDEWKPNSTTFVSTLVGLVPPSSPPSNQYNVPIAVGTVSGRVRYGYMAYGFCWHTDDEPYDRVQRCSGTSVRLC